MRAPHSTEPEHPFVWLERELENAERKAYWGRECDVYYMVSIKMLPNQRDRLLDAIKAWREGQDAPATVRRLHRTCPHPGCRRRIRVEMFACYGHWDSLPFRIKQRIQQSWRARLANPSIYNISNHDEAKHEALEWWEEQRSRRG